MGDGGGVGGWGVGVGGGEGKGIDLSVHEYAKRKMLHSIQCGHQDTIHLYMC